MEDKQLNDNAFNVTGMSYRTQGTATLQSGPVRAPKKHTDVVNPDDVWVDKKQPWAATLHGRLMIRTFARTLGAVGYAWAGMRAQNSMAGYDPENPQNGIQRLAWSFDAFVGKPIRFVVNKLGGDGERAVTFRRTLNNGEGHSLGADIIDNTMNFAAAALFDAAGRNIAGALDPHVQSKWRDDEGNIRPAKVAKDISSRLLNTMEAPLEDLVTAPFYAYQKRGFRNVIDHYSPGFAYDSDRGFNGGSFKLNKEGQIIGTFAPQAAMDLQARFVSYNFNTWAYRKLRNGAVNFVHNTFDPERKNAKEEPRNPDSMYNGKNGGFIRNAARNALANVTQVMTVMMPSVPFFWSMRVSQNKHNSMGILPDGSPLVDHGGNIIRVNKEFQAQEAFFHRPGGNTLQQVQNPFAGDFDPYGKTYGTFDAITNPIGKAVHGLAVKGKPVVEAIAGRNADKAVDFWNSYLNGALYGPYIFAKGEFGNLYGDREMSDATQKFASGVVNADFKETREGLKAIGKKLAKKGGDIHTAHSETLPKDYDPSSHSFVSAYTDNDRREENAQRFREKLEKTRDKASAPDLNPDDKGKWQQKAGAGKQQPIAVSIRPKDWKEKAGSLSDRTLSIV